VSDYYSTLMNHFSAISQQEGAVVVVIVWLLNLILSAKRFLSALKFVSDLRQACGFLHQ